MNEKINYFLFLFRIIKNKLMFALSKQKKSLFGAINNKGLSIIIGFNYHKPKD